MIGTTMRTDDSTVGHLNFVRDGDNQNDETNLSIGGGKFAVQNASIFVFQVLPLYNILWVGVHDSTLTIHYAKPISKVIVRPSVLTYYPESHQLELASQWASILLNRAYGISQKRRRIKILVNPHSGKGDALKTFSRDVVPLLEAANSIFDMTQTTHSGQAVEILENMKIEAYDVVASCSGDGLPHEVFNGLGKRSDAKKALSKIAVVQIPCGSGNAMSCNLNGSHSASLATLAIIKGIPTPLDLISITQGETRTLSFLSQSVGIVAESDLATEHLRFLGAQRFTYGLLARLLTKKIYPCKIAIKVVMDDKQIIKDHYKNEIDNGNSATEDTSLVNRDEDGLPPLKFGTVSDDLPEDWELVSYSKLGNFYCGNMAYMALGANFFPATLPNDGYMDLVCIDGDISRRLALKMLLAAENDKFFEMPGVWYRKILGYRIIPQNQEDGYISIDGERVPFEPFQAEVHKGLGTVLSKSGHFYEAPGPI
ncbi:Sphingoid long chain base kinase 5 [Golovinomyces cichoracearum]|uniref:Sphingoid long chain base kinase 5 n=1 Tax=Golovinomyces cichoracearum TaxID=62708 RepID=A0A420I7T9_9PEZI|nr:Sphingoid long chain base kinase 5 [Golovinomyces cichoracearum]